MRLTFSAGQQAHKAWIFQADIEARAKAHNLEFEERVSTERQIQLEKYLSVIDNIDGLESGLSEYYREEVLLADVPAPFRARTGSGLADPSREQLLIRLENLTGPLERIGVPFDEFQRLHTDRKPADLKGLDWFFRQWAERRDIRKNPVCFATFKDQHLSEIGAVDWVVSLRNRLGLAHYSSVQSAPIPVALMEYEVGEVLDYCAITNGIFQPFAVPATIDQPPYSYFYPTPKEASFGCPMSLTPIESEANLVAELLHPRIPYRTRHLRAVGVVDLEIPAFALDDLRNSHLLAIRLETNRDDFGAEL